MATAKSTDDGIVRVKSAYDVDETVQRLKADIEGKGIKFFMLVDQAQLGADAGLKLNPSKLLVFGNPPLGITFLTANPNAGLDWPVRLLVNPRRHGAGMGSLHGLRLDRPPAQHHQPRGAIQNGLGGHQLDHRKRRRTEAVRSRPPKGGVRS